MERIDGIRGNTNDDPDLADRLAAHEDRGSVERVVLDDDERRRSRLRVETDAGTDLGIVVDRPALAAGDVLEASDDRMIVVAFEPRECLSVSLPEDAASALALGHRIGNHHWDLALEDGRAYVPLSADRHIVERVVHEVIPEATCRVETVDAELFIADGANRHDHGHRHDHDDHDHTHDHAGHGSHADHSHDDS